MVPVFTPLLIQLFTSPHLTHLTHPALLHITTGHCDGVLRTMVQCDSNIPFAEQMRLSYC